MWIHRHARDLFVFIIIAQLEEADLDRAMPLCLDVKNNFTAWTFVTSPQHRTRDIIKENRALYLVKSQFPLFPERGLKF